MPGTRHALVKDIFFAACLEPPSERGAFVLEACRGDDLVRREVESLLAFYREPTSDAQAPIALRRQPRPKPRFRRGHVVAGRYRIDRLRGRGGMGEVYEAYDSLLRQPIALKILYATGELYRRRLVEEVRLARQVTHPAVCRVHDAGIDQGLPFLTMELIQGEDLAARLARSGPLPSDEVTDIAVRLCGALAAAHEAGVLHRDLKPANVLIDRKGGIFVTDFGIATSRARTFETSRTEAGILGTPSYMAPEETQANRSATERTDLYSLGLVLYELLTGGLPFDTSDLDTLLELQRSATPEPPSRRVPSVDARLEATILQMLAKAPNDRPESALAVMEALGGERLAARALEARPTRRERRQVIALLCTLTASPEVTGGALWPELVRIYQARCVASCRLKGGRVVRHLERGLLVHFGYGQTGEQDAESAVQAGLEIVAELRERPLIAPAQAAEMGNPVSSPVLPPAERPPTGDGSQEQVAAAVAIGSSSVVLRGGREIGTARQDDEVARLLPLIEPAAVVVSAAVMPLVRDVFAGVPIEAPPDAPASYRITGAQRRLGLEAGAARLTPLAGREHELAGLERWWRDAAAGRGQVVLLSGEAGVGKSRLVHQLWQSVRHQGVGLEARCSSFQANTPLLPLVRMVAAAVGFDAADAGDEREANLRQGLASLGSRADEIAAVFSAWLPAATGPPLSRLGSSRGADRGAFIAALLEWIVALAEARPVLLVCEDIQWSDPTTREAIDRLVEQVRTAPVLLVLTFRPDFSPTWKGTGVNHLALQPLREEEARALIAAAPRHSAAAVDDAAIVARADGNPLFLEELLHYAIEAAAAPAAIGVPPTLRSLLAARLDRLGPAKRLAQAAAVCGRTFRYSLIAAVAGGDTWDPSDLEAALGRLLDGDIVFQRGTLPRASFSFKHALVQQAAYESLRARERRQLHERVARALPEVDAETVAARPELVAKHWTEAGRPRDAFEWWRRAGLRALERSAYAESSHHLEQALRALPKVYAASERRKPEIELRLALTSAQMGRSGVASAAAERSARRTVALCAQLDADDDLARALYLLARTRLNRGEKLAALRIVERLHGSADNIREPSLRAAIFGQVGNLLTMWGHLADADICFDKCLESYAQAGAAPLAALTLDPLAVAQFAKAAREWLRGRPSEGWRCLDAAIAHADRLEHPFSQATVRLYGAALALLAGEATTAALLLREGAQHAAAIDAIGLLPFASVLELLLEQSSPAPPDLVERLRRALLECEQTGFRLFRSLALARVADLLEEAGRHDDALRAIKEATTEASRRTDTFLLPEILRRRGEMLARLGRHAEAEATLRRSLRVARGEGAWWLELRAALSLARRLAAWGREAAARRALEATLARLPDDVDAPERAEALALAVSLGGRCPSAVAAS
jgi:tetratricopeptide (TPR) repeat protein